MGCTIRRHTLQAVEQGRPVVSQTRGLPTHLHKIWKARREVFGFLELCSDQRNELRFSV